MIMSPSSSQLLLCLLPALSLERLLGFAQLEPKRQSFVGGPQTFSVTFDKDGYASKITVRY